jgi:hypothetical protein
MEFHRSILKNWKIFSDIIVNEFKFQPDFESLNSGLPDIDKYLWHV